MIVALLRDDTWLADSCLSARGACIFYIYPFLPVDEGLTVYTKAKA